MRCLKCSSLEDRVIDSRANKDGYSIRRRRVCLQCGFRFTTYETVECQPMLVVKRDDTREPFKPEKLLGGMIKACEKRPVSLARLERAVEEITDSFTAEGLREIPTVAIGLRVMNYLKQIDQVAFVRYASVYREFQDVGEFSEMIESLEDYPSDPSLQPELFPSSSSA